MIPQQINKNITKGIENLNAKICFYIVIGIFIIANSIAIISNSYIICLIPIALIVLYVYFYSFDKIIYLIIFFTPLSVQLSNYLEESNIDISIPTEILLPGVFLIFILKLLIGERIDKKISQHPISILIYFYLGWMFITSLTSTMPIVSLKYFLARAWFIVTFYFLTVQILKSEKKIKLILWLYILPFSAVIIYTIIHHLEFGLFDQKASNFVMNPFYKDHTSYGAILAFYIPVIFAFLFQKGYKYHYKSFFIPLIMLFLVGLVLSYTRAAWLSVFFITGIFLILLFRIKLRTLLVFGLMIILFVLFNWEQLFIEVSRNKQDSSVDMVQHLKSVTNIRSDDSNLERINRWNSAFRMFEEKPLIGWGPGTYQFIYARFQLSKDKSLITTNAGDRGNAHSEYFGPLAEQGAFGSLTFILVAFYSLIVGFRVYRHAKSKDLRNLSLSLTLGIITYLLHSFLNNFLDTDKASAPFWGFIAILVAIDIYHKQGEVKQETLEQEKLKELPI